MLPPWTILRSLRLAGFEPTTSWLRGQCASLAQLYSHGTARDNHCNYLIDVMNEVSAEVKHCSERWLPWKSKKLPTIEMLKPPNSQPCTMNNLIRGLVLMEFILLLYLVLISAFASQMAWLGLFFSANFLPHYARAWFEPTWVELHWHQGLLKVPLPTELQRRGTAGIIKTGHICECQVHQHNSDQWKLWLIKKHDNAFQVGLP